MKRGEVERGNRKLLETNYVKEKRRRRRIGLKRRYETSGPEGIVLFRSGEVKFVCR